MLILIGSCLFLAHIHVLMWVFVCKVRGVCVWFSVRAKNQRFGLPPPFLSSRKPAILLPRYREKKAGKASAFFSRRGKKIMI